ncbi:MAG: hypothetical protein ACK5O2_01070 [Microthrixaceae bacterium]
MTTSGTGHGSPAANAKPDHQPDGGDWTQQVTDLVTDSVDKVRARTTGPLMGIAQGLVYALVALIVVVPVAIVLGAGLVRFLNWAIPGDVWIVYAIFAVVAWLIGLVCWSRREVTEAL